MSFPASTTASDDAPGSLAVISLGSNLGLARDSIELDSESILRTVLKDLQALSARPLVVSSFYRTSPLDCPPDAPDFVNAIALMQVHPDITAFALLDALQALEAKFGRVRGNSPNQPRSLDLDLICFGSLQCDESTLVLPHPRAHLRRFVMVPLAEVAPDLKLPGQELSATELAQRLSGNQEVVQRVQNTSTKKG